MCIPFKTPTDDDVQQSVLHFSKIYLYLCMYCICVDLAVVSTHNGCHYSRRAHIKRIRECDVHIWTVHVQCCCYSRTERRAKCMKKNEENNNNNDDDDDDKEIELKLKQWKQHLLTFGDEGTTSTEREKTSAHTPENFMRKCSPMTIMVNKWHTSLPSFV